MKSNRASATARLIAAATVLCEFDRDPCDRAPAGAAEWCALFLSTSWFNRLLLRTMHVRAGRLAWRALERATLPGIVDHWMRRKREVDRLCRHAADEGFKQLLVLGAGMDSLAFRMDRQRIFPSIFSADHPATLSIIGAALGSSTASRPGEAGVHLIPIDLTRDDIAKTFHSIHGFDGSASTITVIEGVLMYLSEMDVCKLLGGIAALVSPRKRIIGSWMRSEPGEAIGFRGQSGLISRWLRRSSEPMLWASRPADLPGFMEIQGWQTQSLQDLSKIEPAATDQRRSEGEWLFIAESVSHRQDALP